MTPGLLLCQPTEACGVVGILVPEEDVARIPYCRLLSLLHRGQESAGIAVANEQGLLCHKRAAIGHYPCGTSGSSLACSAQLILLETELGPLILAPGGNLAHTVSLQGRLSRQRYTLNGHFDSRVISRLIPEAPCAAWEAKTEEGLSQVLGSRSLVILSQEKVYALRDPLSVRRLVLGRSNHGDALACVNCPSYRTVPDQCCPTFVSP